MFNVLFDSHVNLKCSILMEQLIMPPLGVITIQLRRVYVLTGSLLYILVLDIASVVAEADSQYTISLGQYL